MESNLFDTEGSLPSYSPSFSPPPGAGLKTIIPLDSSDSGVSSSPSDSGVSSSSSDSGALAPLALLATWGTLRRMCFFHLTTISIFAYFYSPF